MTYRLARAFTVATVVALAFTRHDSDVVAQSASLACGTDMRLLVVAADGNEADLPAIKAAIDYIGTPYDVYLAAQTPGGLMPDPATGIPARLASGCRAKYQGVLLTTGDLGYFPPGGGYASALRADEFTGLATYESTFKIRQVTWYTFPTPDFGLNYPASGVDTSAAPMVAQLTTTGAQVFPYIKRGAGASGIPIQYAWTYLTTPLSPTDTTTTPLLTNAQGNTLAAIHTYPDGRANLAMMFDSNPSLVHSALLSYGVVNWVTSGLFIGDRHVYVSPQVDDLFIDDQQWLTSTPCGTNVDLTGVSHRLVGTDLTAVSNWQTAKRKQALTANLRVTMAFNGFGTTPGYSLTVGGNDRVTGGATAGPAIDTLTPAAKSLGSRFYWVSHTYTHENLDAISYAAAVSEITQNNQVATTLPLPNYSLRFLVQPDVSGPGNANFLKAAFDN